MAGIFSEFTHVGHAALDVVGMKGGGLAVGRIWFAGVVQMEGIFKSARPQRIAAVGSIMADVADEELGYENVDTVVGISINGIAFAYEVSRVLESDMTVFRTTDEGEGSGALSTKYGQVAGKRVVIIDDVLSSGKTMSKTIQSIRDAGGEVSLAIVLVLSLIHI